MANSFSFNSVDLATYGLRVRNWNIDIGQENEVAQLVDRGYITGSRRPAGQLTIDAVIRAANLATLQSYLDSIRGALNQREDEVIKIDSVTDRYWNGRLESIEKDRSLATVWAGKIIFVLQEPAAYANSATSHNTTIDADPHSVSETNAGTERARPVITLTADATLTGNTVEITNATTGQVLDWTGDLVASDVLEIDCEAMVVTLNDVESMNTVDGEFMWLAPGANSIVVSGFSGVCNFNYRARYL